MLHRDTASVGGSVGGCALVRTSWSSVSGPCLNARMQSLRSLLHHLCVLRVALVSPTSAVQAILDGESPTSVSIRLFGELMTTSVLQARLYWRGRCCLTAMTGSRS